jgi:hypothetical protein
MSPRSAPGAQFGHGLEPSSVAPTILPSTLPPTPTPTAQPQMDDSLRVGTGYNSTAPGWPSATANDAYVDIGASERLTVETIRRSVRHSSASTVQRT